MLFRNLIAPAFLIAWTVSMFLPVLSCDGSCSFDLAHLHGARLGAFERVDLRLNVWILAWVQRVFLGRASGLFDGNAFWPAPQALAGSEHMIGHAVIGLPFALATDDAVAVYNWTVMLSFTIAALSTYAFSLWLTGSPVAAVLAGAAAGVMPWRLTELAHLQLLGAHWYPLVWLGALRVLTNERPRGAAMLLTITLALTLLSSYYLAYFVTMTLAVLWLVVVWRRRTTLRSTARFALACAIPYASLIALTVPYLGRSGRGELDATHATEVVTTVVDIARSWAFMGPALDGLWSATASGSASYGVPILVAVLALLSFARPPESAGDAILQRQRIGVAFLWACTIVAILFTLGSYLRIGDALISLPGAWASATVPGFAKIRAPHRWAIVACAAFPCLAAIGASRMAGAAWLSRLPGRMRTSLGVLALAGWFVLLPWKTLTEGEIWPATLGDLHAYRELAALPEGPVLELPWHAHPLRRVLDDSGYLLGATIHWKPILNGATGYPPPTLQLLHQVAQGLPSARSLAQLVRMTDLRWIVIHGRSDNANRAAFRAAAPGLGLHSRFEDERAVIYEVGADDRGRTGGEWIDALRSSAARDQTVSGVAREPIETSAGKTTLQASIQRRTTAATATRLHLEITNAGEHALPGLDYQSEGLLHVRIVFADDASRLVRSSLLPVYDDVDPAHLLEQDRWVISPPDGGSYRVCVDLVQPIGDALHALAVTPVELALTVAAVEGRATESKDLGRRFAVQEAAVEWEWRCGALNEPSP